jgi:hypothetical protein
MLEVKTLEFSVLNVPGTADRVNQSGVAATMMWPI